MWSFIITLSRWLHDNFYQNFTLNVLVVSKVWSYPVPFQFVTLAYSVRGIFALLNTRSLELDTTYYDMIYLLTAIGLPPGGSCTVHIYTQTMYCVCVSLDIPVLKITHLFFDRLKKLRINEIVKMDVEGYFFPSQYARHARVRVECQLLL
jgi:hypothetical protein